ncbi:MAG TPA: peptidoglycan DD-metalloendopeptidase family protein [Thermoleophilaceae bacterium]|nr:peptidoglycan DD-metalloendopeptidase family protein [Thermoleophilaceae bacterium]
MTTAHRDLSQPEPWERSLERSQYRRALLPAARRRLNRKKGIAAAMSAATMAGPGTPMAFAQLSGKPQADLGAETASKRAIEVREGGLPLKVGSQGALVAQVQKALEIQADGIFGIQTDSAVRRYQLRAGVEVDGIVGPVTWATLFPATSAAQGGDAPPAVKQRLERELRAAGARLDKQADRSVNELFGPDGRDESDSRSTRSAPDPGDDNASSEPPVTPPESDPRESPAPRPDRAEPVDTSCGSSTLSSPVKGTVTSGFGPRWGRTHEGLDIAAPTGTAIRAAACGSVSIAGVQDGYGNMVCITHSSSFSTCYAHMSRFAVGQGARVRAGQVIGYVGCTGSCTGPHVHFETRVNGQAQDPTPYLNGSRAASASAASRATTKLDAAGRRSAAAMSVGGGATSSGGGSAPQASWSGAASTSAGSEAVVASAGGGEVAAVPVTPVAVPAEVVAPAAPVEPVAPVAPVEPVAAPVPVEPVAAPVPVEPVAVPVEPVAVPAEPVAAPVEPVAAPVEPVTAPVEPVTAPVEPVAAPVEPVAVPVVEAAPAPVEAAPAPVEPPAAESSTTEITPAAPAVPSQ